MCVYKNVTIVYAYFHIFRLDVFVFDILSNDTLTLWFGRYTSYISLFSSLSLLETSTTILPPNPHELMTPSTLENPLDLLTIESTTSSPLVSPRPLYPMKTPLPHDPPSLVTSSPLWSEDVLVMEKMILLVIKVLRINNALRYHLLWIRATNFDTTCCGSLVIIRIEK